MKPSPEHSRLYASDITLLNRGTKMESLNKNVLDKVFQGVASLGSDRFEEI